MPDGTNKPKIRINGEIVSTPDEVRDLISERVGAEFSLKQVARLGDSKVLQPVLYKRRRFYPKKDVEKLLKRGDIAPSVSDPGRARLRRVEQRDRSTR